MKNLYDSFLNYIAFYLDMVKNSVDGLIYSVNYVFRDFLRNKRTLYAISQSHIRMNELV